MRRSLAVLALTFLIGSVLAHSSAQAENWPRFRGPNGSGVSDLKGVPAQWTPSDYEWVLPLPGVGHSSPVIWGHRIFVTSGDEEGRRILFGVDAEQGKEIWRQSISLATNHLHQYNSYASGTPAVDAERVYVAFADADHYVVTAYSHDGEQKWTRDLGPCTTEHGQGASPIVYENLVIVCNDQAGVKDGAAPPSAVIALNTETGDVVWQAERPSRDASYATPIIVTPKDGMPQVVCLSGASGLSGLDTMTGKEVWTTGSVPKRTVSSPVAAGDLVFATCGQGGKGELLLCVDAAGHGDVSQTHIRYTRQREIPYVPTPVIDGDHLLLWNDDGTFFNADVQTGKNLNRQRIGGNFFASPIMIDGRLYNISQDGEVVVVDVTGPEFKLLGRSPLGDQSYSTPAVGDGRVIFRGFHTLASLKAKS
jgi:outer membrane protein assembly factor BamB